MALNNDAIKVFFCCLLRDGFGCPDDWIVEIAFESVEFLSDGAATHALNNEPAITTTEKVSYSYFKFLFKYIWNGVCYLNTIT